MVKRPDFVIISNYLSIKCGKNTSPFLLLPFFKEKMNKVKMYKFWNFWKSKLLKNLIYCMNLYFALGFFFEVNKIQSNFHSGLFFLACTTFF